MKVKTHALIVIYTKETSSTLAQTQLHSLHINPNIQSLQIPSAEKHTLSQILIILGSFSDNTPTPNIPPQLQSAEKAHIEPNTDNLGILLGQLYFDGLFTVHGS